MLDESLRKGSAIMGAAALSVLGWMRSQRTACREECERHASAGTSRRDRTVASLARLHPALDRRCSNTVFQEAGMDRVGYASRAYGAVHTQALVAAATSFLLVACGLQSAPSGSQLTGAAGGNITVSTYALTTSCSNDFDCLFTDTPRCNTGTLVCVDCIVSSDCPADRPTCTSNACVAPNPCAPLTQCNGQCADTVNDSVNCGACGIVCQPPWSCRQGRCAAE
jgi:hypothetical protein